MFLVAVTEATESVPVINLERVWRLRPFQWAGWPITKDPVPIHPRPVIGYKKSENCGEKNKTKQRENFCDVRLPAVLDSWRHNSDRPLFWSTWSIWFSASYIAPVVSSESILQHVSTLVASQVNDFAQPVPPLVSLPVDSRITSGPVGNDGKSNGTGKNLLSPQLATWKIQKFTWLEPHVIVSLHEYWQSLNVHIRRYPRNEFHYFKVECDTNIKET